jgi:hypothetical protein
MSDDRDQFFNSLFSQDDFSRQLSYENRIVRRVITECGIKPPSWGKLVNLCRAETGQPYFSFQWFNLFFNQFPAVLCGKRIGYCGTKQDDNGNKKKMGLYELTMSDIFKPQKNMLVRAISSALHSAGVDTEQPFVFVFPIVRKMFCAHNLHVEPVDFQQPRIQWRFQHEKAAMTIESSASLFQAIGQDWYQD